MMDKPDLESFVERAGALLQKFGAVMAMGIGLTVWLLNLNNSTASNGYEISKLQIRMTDIEKQAASFRETWTRIDERLKHIQETVNELKQDAKTK